VKTREKVSADHQKLVHGYKKYLRDCFDQVETTSKYADIEIEAGDEFVGLEIETGQNIDHNKEAFENKAERNDERYDDWYVITKEKYRDRYGRYAETILRTEFKEHIEGLCNDKEKD
jgi:hypothetical protein